MMIRKLARILLIDDSEADNFIHSRRLNKLNLAEEIVIRGDGRQGLDYLTAPASGGSYPRPDILFLDINMPVMDGWEFLDNYQHLPDHQRAVVTVAMLTESSGDNDLSRADNYPVIDAYESKPLTKEGLYKLTQRFFPERF